ncbi:hypothetical protein BN940_01351 [Castellaniella defragrans 65Phen]|uniref:Uncharacterized protein n=1 Tax=Castellaniella defragrans (strain DSM 12143 / CCUG 39792 / 65Phen) TaxID=1437824 RepID=W8X0H8_CASD6|nr:hypothetical protein BN940_01351 [Castellaniella defragrans 65Phen]
MQRGGYFPLEHGVVSRIRLLVPSGPRPRPGRGPHPPEPRRAQSIEALVF